MNCVCLHHLLFLLQVTFPWLGAVGYIPGSTWTNVPERTLVPERTFWAGSFVQGLSCPLTEDSDCPWLLSERFYLTGTCYLACL